ncbi:hypothetical protein BRADI_2g16695v3 [Brachypodium distachyon]|uniref:Uncharacterized protein n=1 Tax=Brachypodium distachyon TaxID=15368 RepID=A0A2K2D8X4_BRADI|nr:hypothetical protein BRADI_2g16695v3 [Brachypodium distachyon]
MMAYISTAGAEAYGSCQEAYSKYTNYVSMAQEAHEPETIHDLDLEVVMREGGDMKHGRFFNGDGSIDPATAPSLAHIRARSTSSSPSIRTNMHDRCRSRSLQLQSKPWRSVSWGVCRLRCRPQ